VNKTSIEWVLNPDGTQGYTCSDKTGCLNHTPEGLCLGGLFPCYAHRLARGRLRYRYLGGNCIPAPYEFNSQVILDPFYPRFRPERLEQIRKHKKPVGIFLDDMSDWMGDYWRTEWTEMELQVMRDCPQHRFYTLTKQPQNLIKWSPFLSNCWVGVTATDANMALEAMNKLSFIEASIRYLSLEPLLGRMDEIFEPFPAGLEGFTPDWLIIGACTGRKSEILELCQRNPALTSMPYGRIWTAQPRLEHVQEIVEAADRAGIKVFLKDNLKPLFASAVTIKDEWVWAKDRGQGGLYRQEMP